MWPLTPTIQPSHILLGSAVLFSAAVLTVFFRGPNIRIHCDPILIIVENARAERPGNEEQRKAEVEEVEVNERNESTASETPFVDSSSDPNGRTGHRDAVELPDGEGVAGGGGGNASGGGLVRRVTTGIPTPSFAHGGTRSHSG